MYISCIICSGILSSAWEACEVFCCVCTENGPHGRSLNQHKTSRAKKACVSTSVKCICVCIVKAQGGLGVEGFERVRECPKSHGSVREAFVFSERGLEKAAGVSLQCSSQQESGAHFLCLHNTDDCPVHQCAEEERGSHMAMIVIITSKATVTSMCISFTQQDLILTLR